MIINSMYFGVLLSLLAYFIGDKISKQVKSPIANPLLISTILVIVVLSLFKINLDDYQNGVSLIGYLLPPATVCLAIPLYEKLYLLKKRALVILISESCCVVSSAISIFLLMLMFRLGHEHYVSLLPKFVTTAIAMTGILGNIIAETTFKIFRIKNHIAIGLALDTASHVIGTAKAVELGEVEVAMSSLAIVVSGVQTVLLLPLSIGFI